MPFKKREQIDGNVLKNENVIKATNKNKNKNKAITSTAQPQDGGVTILNFQADRLFEERSYCRLLFNCYRFGSFIVKSFAHHGRVRDTPRDLGFKHVNRVLCQYLRQTLY